MASSFFRVIERIIQLLKGLYLLLILNYLLTIVAAEIVITGTYFVMDQSHIYWTEHLLRFMRIKINKLPGSKQLTATRDNKTIVFMNHRTVADFFVYDKICEFQCSILSRMLVAIIFPGTWMGTVLENTVWYFVRGGRGNELTTFYAWLDRNILSKFSQRKSLIVFPEGHRNTTNNPLPLKRGLIRYAFERKYNIQLVMAFGHEESIDEKKYIIKKGTQVYYHVGEVINPNKYTDCAEFTDYIEKAFRAHFMSTRELVVKLRGN